MSLNKAIESGKEHRDNWEYSFAKRVDKQCRNHGECLWCKGNRTHKDIKDKQKEKADLKEWNNDNRTNIK